MVTGTFVANQSWIVLRRTTTRLVPLQCLIVIEGAQILRAHIWLVLSEDLEKQRDVQTSRSGVGRHE